MSLMIIKRGYRFIRTVVIRNRRQPRPLYLTILSPATNAMSDLKVEHDKNLNEFSVKLARDDRVHKAVLQYSWVKSDTADLHHTEVPPVFRGKGIAKHLAKAALDYMVEKDAKVILSCTYLQKYVDENPLQEYTSRVIGPKL